MTYRNFTLLLTLALLAGCASQPNFLTGEGCEALGYTGELRNIRQPATVHTGLSMDELLDVCTPNSRELLWGCYKPIEHEIYIYWGGGKRTLWEETCHSLGFTGHTEMPNWVAENKARNDYAKRYHRSLSD